MEMTASPEDAVSELSVGVLVVPAAISFPVVFACRVDATPPGADSSPRISPLNAGVPPNVAVTVVAPDGASKHQPMAIHCPEPGSWNDAMSAQVAPGLVNVMAPPAPSVVA
jgi:hypothetical protein